MKRTDEGTAEVDGWFTVARAAALLGVPVPRIFDQIRDGRLQVRFEAGASGGEDRPFVTSPELKQRAAPPPLPAPPPAAAAAGPGAAPGDGEREPEAVAAARRDVARLERELAEARDALEAAERRLDASLKAIYERDVRIARLEGDVATHEKLREGGDTFIRHLEARLDKTEARAEEKEHEIRRLAVGLGEARGEIRLLKPPPPAPPPAWRRALALAAILLSVAAAAGLCGWIAHELSGNGLQREAGLAAGAGVAAAFCAGAALDRLRKSR